MMPRNHTDKLRESAIAWFIRIRDAEADDVIRSKFEQWLMSSQAHQQAYADISKMWETFGSTSDLEKLAGVAEQNIYLQKAERSQHVKKYIVGLMAAVAIGLGGLLGFQSWRAQPTMQMMAQTEVGQIKSQRLNDGTLLTMNMGTVIEVTYYRDQRLVNLKQGEAIFDVARDERRPFIIDSGKAKITVLGTRFAVNRMKKLVRVSVDHGTVKVEQHDSKNIESPDSLILHDGEVAEVNAYRSEPTHVQRQASDAFAFEKGMVIFEEADMDEIAETLSRYRKLPLIVEQPVSAKVHISSMLKADAIETFINQMPEMAPVSIVQTSKATIIKGTSSRK
ncbi:FecR family protein [Methylotenera sp. N17]|jgi:transmembrane sensor|uniref:FecR family protein n=1 Tax=Methylotenera sp. N17 TaxID=1502761 RepID=UPI000647E97F|nr:FecR domain-containing protein [Methylotenera sp. N17]